MPVTIRNKDSEKRMKEIAKLKGGGLSKSAVVVMAVNEMHKRILQEQKQQQHAAN